MAVALIIVDGVSGQSIALEDAKFDVNLVFRFLLYCLFKELSADGSEISIARM